MTGIGKQSMGSDKSSEPEWLLNPPSMFDIVTGYFPETKPKGGVIKLRPMLVTRVLRHRSTGDWACEVAYGTSVLKTWLRMNDDIIIQNSSDLDSMGLAQATRFVLDPAMRATLPWSEAHFGCWSNHKCPKLGTLTVEYQKDYAFAMMRFLGS